MYPTGSYERLYYDIIHRYNEDEGYVTFGILIADPRQSEAKEYITNYLDYFDKESKNYFDFFIPGYCEFNFNSNEVTEVINVSNKRYYFYSYMFDDFCKNLKKDFGIKYTFNPMLILIAMRKANINTAQYIVIELDNYGTSCIRRSGELFLEIFDIAKKNPDLLNIRNSLCGTYVKGNWLNSIINLIGENWLTEITKKANELKRYRIKHF